MFLTLLICAAPHGPCVSVRVIPDEHPYQTIEACMADAAPSFETLKLAQPQLREWHLTGQRCGDGDRDRVDKEARNRRATPLAAELSTLRHALGRGEHAGASSFLVGNGDALHRDSGDAR